MNETLTRRGLLGMFAAGVGAAVLPSGIIMPVRKIVTASALPAPDMTYVFGSPASGAGRITQVSLTTKGGQTITYRADALVEPGDYRSISMNNGQPTIVVWRREGDHMRIHHRVPLSA